MQSAAAQVVLGRELAAAPQADALRSCLHHARRRYRFLRLQALQAQADWIVLAHQLIPTTTNDGASS